MSICTLGSMGDDSDPRWGNETEGEIVDIIAVLEAVKAIGAFAGSFDITSKSDTQIEGLLTAMNHSELTRVVCVCTYNGKWVYSKHRERKTWEIPGGHIEEGETWLETAERELYEETGAIEIEVEPICLYSISTYALLCYANIKKFEKET